MCAIFLLERYEDQIPLAYVHTYGCQQNVSDGEKIKGMLADMGYGFTDDVRNANLVLLNTCAVRENAEDRVFGVTGAMKHQRLQDEELVLGGMRLYGSAAAYCGENQEKLSLC